MLVPQTGQRPAPRLAAVDCVRGGAVLCMILLHAFDSFGSAATKKSFYGDLSYYLGGGAAPMFLALAGLATSLAITQGAGAMFRRGVEIWLLSLLFRIQEWALGGDGSYSGMLLRVDVLNCIGLSILLCVLVHRLARHHEATALAVTGLITVLVTPLIAKADWLANVPGPLRHHLGGPPQFALFPLFPWAGVALLGAALGAYATKDGKAHTATRLFGLAKWLFVAYPLIFLVRALFPGPLAFSRTNIHPVFTLERTALALGLLWPASLYLERTTRFVSTFTLLGRRSLVIYWVHVELCYGLYFHRYKGTFDWPATLAFTLAMMAFCTALAFLPASAHLKRTPA
ncbi:MAG: DUF1624 domain-containing protein [Deltaproteobacteria bacterium]|nr:DUF1624 domain-containing protein [Deltaproteobacteria bacterium]